MFIFRIQRIDKAVESVSPLMSLSLILLYFFIVQPLLVVGLLSFPISLSVWEVGSQASCYLANSNKRNLKRQLLMKICIKGNVPVCNLGICCNGVA